MSDTATETRVLSLWNRLQRLPGGRRLYAKLLMRLVPYSGSIKPIVVSLEPGRSVIHMRDRRPVRNHLGSVHAIALANLGELASGLAMIAALAPSVRAIVTGLEVTYEKKARGTLLAVGRADPPTTIDDPIDVQALAQIKDAGGDVVSTVTVTWRLGPRPA